MIRTADVVVIGAGVHGASTAFHLAKAGAGRVVIIDKLGVAGGPTAKSGAMIRPIFTEAPYIQLVLETTAMMEHWKDAVGGDPGFVKRGFLRFTQGFGAADLGGDLALMKHLGAKFEVVDAAVLRDRVPDADFRRGEKGLWLPRAGYADPIATTRSLVRAAVRHGATLVEGVQAQALVAKDSRIVAVKTDKGTIRTRAVVNCAGPWSARLAADVGVKLAIEAHRGGTTLFHRPQSIPVGSPILSDGVNQVYLRDVGEAMLRAAHFGWTRDRVDPDKYDETIPARQLASLRADLAKRFRSMNRAIYAGGFSAIYDMTPDAHPIIGQLGGVEGFWCNCGWSGNGFAPAPAAGRALAQQIVGGKSDISLAAFAWPRPAGLDARADLKWIHR